MFIAGALFLNSQVEKLTTMKRKASEAITEEVQAAFVCKKRLEHLKEHAEALADPTAPQAKVYNLLTYQHSRRPLLNIVTFREIAALPYTVLYCTHLSIIRDRLSVQQAGGRPTLRLERVYPSEIRSGFTVVCVTNHRRAMLVLCSMLCGNVSNYEQYTYV